MKDPFERTKVVLRHLPPAISQSALMEQIDGRFAGRYKWVCFRPGRNSQKNQRFSWAYIDFRKSEDVVDFAEFFDGHVFVNEKGTQFKAVVEYAPSQRVPKSWSKKDGREGTIFKDPEYLEFLELLAKPAENLPSAEIQLERREAERAGGAKEMLIVTPLMDFVRQKRAAKSGSKMLSANGKLSRRSGGVSASSSSPSSSKRGSEKRRVTTSMYVLRDSTKNGSGKGKSTYILLPRREEQQPSDKIDTFASGTKALEDETVTANGTGTIATGKKRLVLLKGKEREVSHGSSGSSQQQTAVPSAGSSSVSAAFKQIQRHEASGRIIRGILSKEAQQSQPQAATYQSEQQMHSPNSEKDRRPPRPSNSRLLLKDNVASNLSHARVSDVDKRRSVDDKVVANDAHCSVFISEKQDKRTRNKDRPDRGVWTPLRRSDGSSASDNSLSSSSSLTAQVLSDSLEGMSISPQVAGIGKTVDDNSGIHSSRLGRGTGSLPAYDIPSSHGEMKGDIHAASKSGEGRSLGSGRGNHLVLENGSHRHVGRRGPAHGMKEADGSLTSPEAKISKRGATGYGSHEKQIWVQKSGSGS